VKILVLSLIFFVQMTSLGTRAGSTDICLAHGPWCAHGSECPAALTQAADEHSAECPSGGHGKSRAGMKKYRCALTSCHGEAMGGGTDAPFAIDTCRKPDHVCQTAVFDPEKALEPDIFPIEVLEPPEAFYLS